MRIYRVTRWAVVTILCVSLCGLSAAEPAVDDYNFAAWLYNNGRYDLAVGAYESFLKTHAGHEKVAEARFGLAQSYFHLSRFAEAMPVYEALRERHPAFDQMAEVLFQMGQTAVARKDFARAERLFAQVIEEHAGHYLADWALARQGACLLSLDRYAEAEAALVRFVSQYAPDSRPPRRADPVRGMVRRMEEAGVGAQEAFHALVERSVFYLGIVQFNTAKFGEALVIFDRYLALYPDAGMAGEARFRRAQCLYRTDRFDAAATAYAPIAGAEGPFAATAAYERGLALYKAGKAAEASVALAQMAERFPADANAGRAALYAGTFLYESGKFAEAAERLRGRIERAFPFADEAAYWLGMSLLRGGQPAEAEAMFTRALREHASSELVGDMRLGLADARLAQDNLAGAAEAFSEYAARFGKSDAAPAALYSACVALHRSGDYAGSEARCEQFLSRFKDRAEAVQVLFLSGENRFLRRQYDAAVERYQAFLAHEATTPEQRARAHFRLAWCHRHGQRFEEALAELDRADFRAAGREVADEALYVRGASLFDVSRYEEAERALTAYLRADGDGRFADDAILKIAVGHARSGAMARAVTGFERFLKAYPESELAAQTRYQLAESLFALKRYDEAARAYAGVLAHKEAVALHPFAQWGLGLCAFEQGDWSGASERFGVLVADYSRSDLVPQALFRQGQSLMRAERWQEAEVPLLALASGHGRHELARPAWVMVGTARQHRKAWGDAADAFARAARTGSGDDQSRVLYELAWSYREAGREEESLRAFRDLASAFPDDPLTADAHFHLAEAQFRKAGASDGAAALSLYREAAASYGRVLDLVRDQRLADKALYRLGWCRWNLQEYAGAAEAFDALVAQFGGSDLAADSLFQAAQALLRDGRTDEAVKRFGVLTSRREYAGFEWLTEALVAQGDGLLAMDRPGDALAPLQRAIESGGDSPSATRAHFLAGKAQYQRNRYREANEHFTAVTRRSRGALGAEAQFYLGQIEQAQERFEQALVAYLRVQAIYGAFPEWVAGSLLETGKCHEALGRPGDAREAYLKVTREYGKTHWAPLAHDRLKGLGGGE